MQKDYLHDKLPKIETVAVPDFLMEGIKKKIEIKRVTDKKNGNYALIFALALLLVNFGVISTYSSKEDTQNTVNTEVNPYSFSQSSFYRI